MAYPSVYASELGEILKKYGPKSGQRRKLATPEIEAIARSYAEEEERLKRRIAELRDEGRHALKAYEKVELAYYESRIELEERSRLAEGLKFRGDE